MEIFIPVIVACITEIGGVVGSYLAIRKGIVEQDIRSAQREQKQQDNIDEIRNELTGVKDRLDKHNGYAEKFAEASKDISLLQKDVLYMRERIDSLEVCKK
jgi:predicted  nucleic acid-binding Zn-ribbon protein